MIDNFVKQEEENFALFSYINELNDELEGLRTRVDQLRLAIEEAKDLNTQRSQKQTETLDKLKKELEEETKLADEAEKQLRDVNFITRVVQKNFLLLKEWNFLNFLKFPKKLIAYFFLRY